MRRQRGNADSASGWLLALSAAALASTAHGLAGGTPSDSALAALLTTLLAWGGSTLARRGGTLTLVAVLAVTQAAQHLLLTEVAGGHLHDPPPVNGWVMLATHAIATLLTAGLLTGAGTALGTVTRTLAWLAGRLRVLLAGPVRVPVAAGTASALPARPGPLLEVQFRQVCARRGPPVRS